MKVKPDFIVIGAQKAGSTFVQACLSDHPQIWMPNGETPYFEDPDFDGNVERFFAQVFKERREPILGIKRPQFIGRGEVPARIASEVPKAKLIAILRNPVARTISAYYHYIRDGFLPNIDPNEGLPKLLDGDPEILRFPRAWEILEFSHYYRHLSLYRSFLQRGAMKVLLHEDIVADPLTKARELYEFLGADASYEPTGLHDRPQAVVYNHTRLGLLRRVALLTHRYSHDRTRMYGYRSPFHYGAAGAWRKFDDKALASIFGNEKTPLSLPLLRRLRDHFTDDVNKLENLIDRDLSLWRT